MKKIALVLLALGFAGVAHAGTISSFPITTNPLAGTLGANAVTIGAACTGWTLPTGWACGGATTLLKNADGSGSASYTTGLEVAGNALQLTWSGTGIAGSITRTYGTYQSGIVISHCGNSFPIEQGPTVTNKTYNYTCSTTDPLTIIPAQDVYGLPSPPVTNARATITAMSVKQVTGGSVTAANGFTTGAVSASLPNSPTVGGYPTPFVACASGTPIKISHMGQAYAFPLAGGECTIPGGRMGINGAVEAKFYMTAGSQLSNNKTYEIDFGHTQMAISTQTTNGDNPGLVVIQNRGSWTSQVGAANSIGTGTSNKGSPYTATEDTTKPTAVSFVVTPALEPALTITGDVGSGGSCTVTMASGAPAVGRFLYVTGGSGCGSGTQNVGTATTSYVQISVSNGTTSFLYPCTCTGGTPVGASIQLFTPVTLERYVVTVYPSPDASPGYAGYSIQQVLGQLAGNYHSFGQSSGLQWTAVSFTTSQAYSLGQAAVQLALSAGTPTTSPITAYLYSDSGGSGPSTLLATATNSVSSTLLSTYINYNFQFPATALAAATRYWIALKYGTVDASNYPKISLLGSTYSTEGYYNSADGVTWASGTPGYIATMYLYSTP